MGRSGEFGTRRGDAVTLWLQTRAVLSDSRQRGDDFLVGLRRRGVNGVDSPSNSDKKPFASAQISGSPIRNSRNFPLQLITSTLCYYVPVPTQAMHAV